MDCSVIKISDFDKIGVVAKHCDMAKLCVAINEAIRFDVSELFCDCADSVLGILERVRDEEVLDLSDFETDFINGSTYIGCNGRNKTHFGLVDMIAYYSYARYLMLNGFNDTPNGMVVKTNDFSMPKPLKEVEAFANKYRDMGLISFKKLKDFLCHSKELDCFLDCDECDCAPCKSGTKAKGFGVSGQTIRKRI